MWRKANTLGKKAKVKASETIPMRVFPRLPKNGGKKPTNDDLTNEKSPVPLPPSGMMITPGAGPGFVSNSSSSCSTVGCTNSPPDPRPLTHNDTATPKEIGSETPLGLVGCNESIQHRTKYCIRNKNFTTSPIFWPT